MRAVLTKRSNGRRPGFRRRLRTVQKVRAAGVHPTAREAGIADAAAAGADVGTDAIELLSRASLRLLAKLLPHRLPPPLGPGSQADHNRAAPEGDNTLFSR